MFVYIRVFLCALSVFVILFSILLLLFASLVASLFESSHLLLYAHIPTYIPPYTHTHIHIHSHTTPTIHKHTTPGRRRGQPVHHKDGAGRAERGLSLLQQPSQVSFGCSSIGEGWGGCFGVCVCVCGSGSVGLWCVCAYASS